MKIAHAGKPCLLFKQTEVFVEFLVYMHEPEYKLSGIEARGKTVTGPSKSLRRFTF